MVIDLLLGALERGAAKVLFFCSTKPTSCPLPPKRNLVYSETRPNNLGRDKNHTNRMCHILKDSASLVIRYRKGTLVLLSSRYGDFLLKFVNNDIYELSSFLL